ncbi:hypothetical protein [Pseudomonas sp. RL_15y_Pfl2_60]|uniref:hypothetical protein n=1 Tax=Pseudomonas sp. RL_15y_Pfl2_60 TaxID=3088709 RepID=UPI0030DC4D51
MEMLAKVGPHAISNILILALIVILAIMLLGNISGSKDEDTRWLHRGVGVEVAFVLLPFVFYGIGSLLNGSYSKFIASPELPMAAMILAALTIISLMKGLAASKNQTSIENFLVFTFLAILLLVGLGAYIAWLAFAKDVSPWFGALNSLIIFGVVIFSFAVHAAMAERIKKTQAVDLAGSTKESHLNS